MNKFLFNLFNNKINKSALLEIRYFDKSNHAHQEWFDNLESASAFVESLNKEYNVFYGVSPRIRRGGSIQDLSNTDNKVFVDFDFKAGDSIYKENFLNRLRLYKPNCVVLSGHGIHAYWLTEEKSQNELREIKERLASFFNSDSSVVDPPRIMRLPGSFNNKNSEHIETQFKWKHSDISNLSWLPEKVIKTQIENQSDFLGIEEELINCEPGNRMKAITKVAGKCFARGDSLETITKYIIMFFDRYKKWTENELVEKNDLTKQLENMYNNWSAEEKISAEEKDSLLKPLRQATTKKEIQEVANEIVKNIDAVEYEFKFESPKPMSSFPRKELYKINSDFLDEFPLFSSKQFNMIIGGQGGGKTTVALNLAKAFIENNNINVLYLNSVSENSDEDLNYSIEKIQIPSDKFLICKMTRENPKVFMKAVLNKYKELKSKYPEIVFIDSIDKMNRQIGPLHIAWNSEVLAELANDYPICLIALNQIASPVAKTKQNAKIKNDAVFASDGAGGATVSNSTGNTIGIQKKPTFIDGQILSTKLVWTFSKVRGMENNQKLHNKSFVTEINQKNLVIDFNSFEEDIKNQIVIVKGEEV